MHTIGKRTTFLSTVAIIAVVWGISASAQALRDAGPPAELPPPDFTGNQYVDSEGCVFIRAGTDGTVIWVPRVTRTREQLCGFQPSAAVSETDRIVPAEDDLSTDLEVAGIEAATQVDPATEVLAPVATEDPTPLPTAIVLEGVTQTAATSAATTAPVPAAQVTFVAPQIEPTSISLAQACEGLSGVQSHLINERTGHAINCGDGATVIHRTATSAEPTAVSQPSQNRLTRAQACADTTISGRRYVSTRTGAALDCVVQSSRTVTYGVSQLRQTYSNPLDEAPGTTTTPQRSHRGSSNFGTARYTSPLDSAPGSVGVSH